MTAPEKWPFDRPPAPPVIPEPQPGEISTAAALASYRDELTQSGFGPDDALALVFIAAEAEIRKNGLAVRPAAP